MRSKKPVLVESKLAGAAKMVDECSFLPQKHGRKKEENVSLSQRLGGGIIFYDCERNLRVSHLRGDCGDGTMWRDTSLRVTKATMLTTHREVHCGQKKAVN